MFERYTEKARRVIFFARYEASQYGSTSIDTEHVLLGLVREAKGILSWAPGLTAEDLRKRIDAHVLPATPLPANLDMPLSDDCRRAMEFASNEADRLAHRHIGTEHLFLGLLDVADCFAAKLLHDGGADAGRMRQKLAEQSQPPKPWSFQRASYRNLGFRTPSGETVEIHGSRWNVDYVRDAINMVRAYNWHWCKATWEPRDVVVHRKTGCLSFDLGLASDSDNFALVTDGWKKDHCFICRWELFESEDEHGRGYTNGHDWLCLECHDRFWDHPDFFSSSLSEMT
jgi:Clp amino terminal domain, pathogenicity island component